jgi:NAD(P)H-dependent FMN reductase
MDAGCEVLLVSGSLRAGSTNTALLRTAQLVAPEGVHTVLYDEMAALPHFNPDDDVDPLDLAATRLRERVRSANAILFATPEYAGALPGSFKNLLDWTVGGEGIYGKAVAWINASTSPGGAIDAHESLRKVMAKTGAEICERACLRIPVKRRTIGSDGLVAGEEVRRQLAGALEELVAGCARCGCGATSQLQQR